MDRPSDVARSARQVTHTRKLRGERKYETISGATRVLDSSSHSLSGLVPVGAYMIIHLITNASVLDSPATYQRLVHQIHGLGKLLPVVEWCFIFIPILFHAILGWVIDLPPVKSTSACERIQPGL